MTHHEMKRCLETFYAKHNPEKLSSIEGLLKSQPFEGIFEAIEKKYGMRPEIDVCLESVGADPKPMVVVPPSFDFSVLKSALFLPKIVPATLPTKTGI